MTPLHPPAILDALPGVVYTAGPEGFLSWSADAESLTGRPVALLLGRGFDDCVLPSDLERLAAGRAASRQGSPRRVEYRLLTPEGALKWVREQVCRCDTGMLVGSLFDISDEKHQEARRELEVRMETVGELAAGVAHAVNNPLSGVLNYAQLAQRLAPAEERVRDSLAGIVAEGERILAITQSLLTFTRTGGLRTLAVDELVGATLTLLRRQLRDEFIIIRNEVPVGLPAVRARGREIHQVLHCLLQNSRQALNARYPGRSPEKVLTVSAVTDGATVSLHVEDTGEGIAEDRLESIFRPFETTRTNSRGLGLTISLAIAEEHGGTLSAACTDGRTTFSLALPTPG